jgi:hypothetical protein
MLARSLILDDDGERVTFNVEGQTANPPYRDVWLDRLRDIHSGAYNQRSDRTRVSLEMRFWRTAR